MYNDKIIFSSSKIRVSKFEHSAETDLAIISRMSTLQFGKIFTSRKRRGLNPPLV